MGYGTPWVRPVPHVYVAMIPDAGTPQGHQGKACLRAELSFTIEPNNSYSMTLNSVASQRNLEGGPSAARVMNAANTEAARYALYSNDCMNYAAKFMSIASERYAHAKEFRRLKAENKLIKRGSSKSMKTLLAEIMKVYTDPELKKAAEELKKIESSSKELAKQSSKKIETKQAPNKA
ncbi:hypothetical protein AeMF1_012575, partial [Aphanomyces euteiches]